jgi:hypothetical protein
MGPVRPAGRCQRPRCFSLGRPSWLLPRPNHCSPVPASSVGLIVFGRGTTFASRFMPPYFRLNKLPSCLFIILPPPGIAALAPSTPRQPVPTTVIEGRLYMPKPRLTLRHPAPVPPGTVATIFRTLIFPNFFQPLPKPKTLFPSKIMPYALCPIPTLYPIPFEKSLGKIRKNSSSEKNCQVSRRPNLASWKSN